MYINYLIKYLSYKGVERKGDIAAEYLNQDPGKIHNQKHIFGNQELF